MNHCKFNNAYEAKNYLKEDFGGTGWGAGTIEASIRPPYNCGCGENDYSCGCDYCRRLRNSQNVYEENFKMPYR